MSLKNGINRLRRKTKEARNATCWLDRNKYATGDGSPLSHFSALHFSNFKLLSKKCDNGEPSPVAESDAVVFPGQERLYFNMNVAGMLSLNHIPAFSL